MSEPRRLRKGRVGSARAAGARCKTGSIGVQIGFDSASPYWAASSLICRSCEREMEFVAHVTPICKIVESLPSLSHGYFASNASR